VTKRGWILAGVALFAYAILAASIQTAGASTVSATTGETQNDEDSLAADLSGNDTILDDFNAQGDL
jgi:hypothetical protein